MRTTTRSLVVHVTTTDISLALLLGPQLRAFVDAGYDVIGVSAPGPFVDRLRADGIEHEPLAHATRSWAPVEDARALWELRSLFRTLRPDIVHTHNPKPGIYGRLAAAAARVPVVVNTVHGLYAQPDDGWTRRAAVYGLERLAARCSQAELVQNPEDLEVLAKLGIPRTKLRLLGNGIDLDRFDPTRVDAATRDAVRAELGAGPTDVLVGAVGRLVWEKGYREVLAAAERLRTKAPNVKIAVVGPEEAGKADAIDAQTLAQARANGVVFAGHRDDVEAVYAALDVYVLASYREGWPRSAMEAAAMGVPVVATDIRGCRQVVSDGETGILVAVRDADALADAIATLAHDGAARRSMGEAGRAKAIRDFDQRTVIDTTLETYDRLLGARLARSAA